MIAVNAWDDEREVVARFVADQELKQKVLLMGSKVAAEKYGVTVYPTNFLIDKEGVVVKYETAFHPDMMAKLEAEIVELLEGQKNDE